ncbi:putative FmdB family regulatory protein [Allocatelliglobosispora scoriae]|uniref:Putative FmdB family regulatory protein n=1 Tax=Allocatelliglobosispora scoriae TaxID=643052 RepID=A0A841BSU9_9ACTN|nr:FmdB family zinc ribbon protein [Allocatelliglobosispora scoriae]MBB5870468.1 putative FmdB family regulatory protein [Allocatelliglobosispora scoriae]
MPTYQYACTACGHQLEAVQSFSDESLTVCPACDGKLRKLFSGVGVVFKGSGFYRTDSRNAASAAAPASPSSTPSSTPAPAQSTPAPSSSSSTPAPAA